MAECTPSSTLQWVATSLSVFLSLSSWERLEASSSNGTCTDGATREVFVAGSSCNLDVCQRGQRRCPLQNGKPADGQPGLVASTAHGGPP